MPWASLLALLVDSDANVSRSSLETGSPSAAVDSGSLALRRRQKQKQQ